MRIMPQVFEDRIPHGRSARGIWIAPKVCSHQRSNEEVALKCSSHVRRRGVETILLAFACGTFACAQEMVSDDTSQAAQSMGVPLPSSAPQETTAKDVALPCMEPPPLLRWEDYRGPFQRVVGAFAQKLELRAVHPPRYKPGTVLCSLNVKDKFSLFVRDTFHPISIFEAAFSAGLDQASNRDPTFGQGAGGFGRRFGADFAGQTTRRFFTDFAYPTVFAEDPRYYRLIHGSGRRRFLHAVEHTFVAQRDSGKHMFNISQWTGTATAVALNDLYHPGNQRGLGPGMRVAAYSLASDMGFDVLREFWPDIAHKLHMPFRDTRPPPATETSRSLR